jgi:hypothetical protein
LHQQAVAENWDLPNTEIFQSKDVASGNYLDPLQADAAGNTDNLIAVFT